MIEFSDLIRSLALNLAMLKGDSTAVAMLQPQEFTCVAVTAFAEARGEGEDGMAMVVKSIMNRRAVNEKPGCLIASKSYDGYRRWRGKNPLKTDVSSWHTAQLVTINVIMGTHDLGECSGVTHFLNPKALSRLPSWASKQNRVCKIGNHIAYRVIG